MDYKEGMGDYPVTLNNVNNPKIIILFWYFSMQTMESTGDATTQFHTSI